MSLIAQVNERNDKWWAHQPPEVRALREMRGEERYRMALLLANQGFIIDAEICAFGDRNTPVNVHQARASARLVWVPNMIQHDLRPLPPGWNFPGYNSSASPPPNSIVVLSKFVSENPDGSTTYDDSAFDALEPHGGVSPATIDWVSARAIDGFEGAHYPTTRGLKAIAASRAYTGMQHAEDDAVWMLLPGSAPLPAYYWVKIS